MSTEQAAERIERLRERNPDAVLLATMVSTAVRVEPRLLRHARLRLLPDSDVGAEADLWSSDLLASASPVALTLDPDVARLLRRELARRPTERQDAIELVEAVHHDRHWSLRLEEAVNALDVQDGPDARDAQEQLLLAAVDELRRAGPTRSATGEDRAGIARWLLGAYARLGPRARGTSGSGAAALAAGFHLDGRIAPPDDAPADVEATWLPWLIATAGASDPRWVRVAFTAGDIVLELLADPPTTPDRPDVFPAPGTDPVSVDVTPLGDRARGGPPPPTTRHHLVTGQPLVLPIRADEVALATVDGAQHTARRPGIPPSAGRDFGAIRAALRPCLAREEATARTLEALERGTWWTSIGGPEGIGKSVVLNAAIDELLHRGKDVVVWHFLGVEPSWDEPLSLVASLEAQLRAVLADLAPSTEDHPGRRMEDVLARAAAASEAGGRGIVVAIDGLPGDAIDEVRGAIGRLPFPSKPPTGVRFLVSTRWPAGVRDWLEDGDPRVSIDLGQEPADRVCDEMVAAAASGLRVAFGLGIGVPAQTFGARTVAAAVLGVDQRFRDALVTRAGTNPRRLARILDWILAQPPGSVTFDRIPVTLTTSADDVWARAAALSERVSARHPDWIGWALVAQPGFTLADYLDLEARNTAPVKGVDLAESRAPIGDVPELVIIGTGADPATTPVGPADPTVVEDFERRFGPSAVVAAHAAHARALGPLDVPTASAYRIAAGVHHHVEAGDVHAAAALLLRPDFLARRWAVGGPVGLAEDLDRVIVAGGGGRGPALYAARRAVDVVAAHPATTPELLESLLANEYVRQGGPPGDLGPAEPPLPLLLERIVDVSATRPGWSFTTGEPVVATSGDGTLLVAGDGTFVELTAGQPGRSSPGPAAPWWIAASGAQVAIGTADQVVVLDPSGSQTTLRSPSPPTALVGDGDGFATGHQDGTVVRHHRGRDGTWQPSMLTGHTGAVTALGRAGELLVSGGADGSVRVWSAAGTPRTRRTHRHPVHHVAGLDGGLVASADDHGAVVVWDVGADVTTSLPGHHGRVSVLLPARDGGLVSAGTDGAVLHWSRSGGSRPLRSQGPAVLAAAILALPPGRGIDLVTAEAGGTIRWWATSDGIELGAQHTNGVVGTVHQILTDASGDAVLVHDGGLTGLVLPTAPGDSDPPAGQRALDLDPSGGRAVLGTRNGYATIDTRSGEVVDEHHLDREDRPVAACWTAGERVAWLTAAGDLHVGAIEGVRSGVSALAASADDPSLLTVAGRSGEVVEVSGESLSAFGMTFQLHGAPTALARSSGVLLAGLEDGTLLAATGFGSAEVRVHEARLASAVNALAVVPGGFGIVGTADGTVWRWAFPSPPEALGAHPGGTVGVAAVAGDPSRPGLSWAVSGGADGVLRIWDTSAALTIGAAVLPAPVDAIATAADCVVVRLASGELWVLRTPPTSVPPATSAPPPPWPSHEQTSSA